jgi:hypothetical protein
MRQIIGKRLARTKKLRGAPGRNRSKEIAKYKARGVTAEMMNDELKELIYAIRTVAISPVHHSSFIIHHFCDVADCRACG